VNRLTSVDLVKLLHMMHGIFFGMCLDAFHQGDVLIVLSCRPETVESLFIAFRLTGDVRYRNYGWNIFQSIEKHCRVETGGYASIINVDEVPARQEDKMETFLMVCCLDANVVNVLPLTLRQSETLKYLYLLFSNSSVLPLDSTLSFSRTVVRND